MWFRLVQLLHLVWFYVYWFFSTLFSEQRQEGLESSEEFFDSESQLSSDDYGLSLLFHEETSAQPQAPPQAQPQAPPQAQPQAQPQAAHFPWFVLSCVPIYVSVFIFTMYQNDCPRNTLPPKTCFPHFFGRFAFQSIDQNPLLGPARATLLRMGGLYAKKVFHMHQIWRLFSNIWLHDGLTQLFTDIIGILGVGIPLEQKFGSVRVALLYLISGAGGSIFSTLFFMPSITVGASGALAGLSGGTLSDIAIEYWSLHLDKGLECLIAMAVMLFNVVVTILQHGDNLANLGGFITGVLVGFVIFTRPPVNRFRCTALLVVTFIGLLVGVVLALKGMNLSDYCSWCTYLDCIPLPYWSCKHRGIDCDRSELESALILICKGNGKTGIYSLTNGVPPHPFEELCARLCDSSF